MTTTPRKLSISQLSLYNPSRLSDEEIVASFAARQAVFDRIMADIASEKPKSRAQHHLIVGQRGMGKSTLLARIAAELRTKPELSAVYIPLVFAEEQYAVDRLSKFWLNCLDSLADACEKIGDTVAPKQIDDLVRKLESRPGSTAALDEGQSDILDAFLAEAKTLQRRPVLLVDNLQLVFERITEQQQHVLRELLMRPGAPVLIGASPSPPPESQDYGAAFYDHFKTHYLPPLSVAEMRQLMLTLAEKFGNTTIRDRITRHPHRLSVLRQLTGGNPRTTVTLFFLYAEDFADTVFGDLENLLDRVTPLYKARFEELSAQQQVVASAIANHWDPVTARQLADATSLPITGISPQLDRLERIGFIERVNLHGESSTGYQIAERFFNVWFLMRSSSRRKKREVEFLTRFIESFYEKDDRSRLAQLMLGERDLSPDRHLWARALASTLNPAEARDLTRHAELDALRQTEAEARRQLEEVIDFSQLSPAALAFDELKKKLIAIVPHDSSVTPEEFAEKVLGDRNIFKHGFRRHIAAKDKISSEQALLLLNGIEEMRNTDTSVFGEDSVSWIVSRLRSGQLASFDDISEWNAAFHSASAGEALILADTATRSVLEKIDGSAVESVARKLQPSTDADQGEWFAWAFLLQEKLQWFQEAERAYRHSFSLKKPETLMLVSYGNLLHFYLKRYCDAEQVYTEAAQLDPNNHLAWLGIGAVLRDQGIRLNEAETAFRKAIHIKSDFETSWIELGLVLRQLNDRHVDAESAFNKALSIDPKSVAAWNNLGNLYCDGMHRYDAASHAYEMAIQFDGVCEAALQNVVFLHRDYMGEGVQAQSHFDRLLQLGIRIQSKDVASLHYTLFAAYAENWGKSKEALGWAIAHLDTHPHTGMTDDWHCASAVLLHLNYGEQLLAFLRERGDDARLRPWYEALVALHKGDRRFLQNLAPEVRTTAEVYFDQIEKRLNALPEKTRRRPLPKPVKTKAAQGRKRR